MREECKAPFDKLSETDWALGLLLNCTHGNLEMLFVYLKEFYPLQPRQSIIIAPSL